MKKPALIGIALLGLVETAQAEEAIKPMAKEVVGECHGINSCKGTGDCGGKGHGWKKISQKACTDKGGEFKGN